MAHSQAQLPHDNASSLSDEDGAVHAATASFSSLSDVLSSRRYFSASAIAKSQAPPHDRPQQALAVSPKTQLTQREEGEVKAARNNRRKKARKTTVLTELQEPHGVQNRSQLQAQLDSEETATADAKPKRTRGGTATRELEKQQKTAEIRQLMAMAIPAPLPYKLKLPNLPPRQNHTGRNLKLKLFANDPTFPLTPRVRELFVEVLMNAIRDCRIAQDKVALTTNYWHVWLKPIHEGRYTYKEIDMERVCRKLINIAEALHLHGLGATDIYCPETIRKAMAARPMLFESRIEKLSILMCKTKARCNEFMMGNTLDDTVALIDLKLSDQKSNNANNYLRSVKVEQTNQLFQMPKGTKWPKGEGSHIMKGSKIFARGYGTPQDMMTGDFETEHDDIKGGDGGSDAAGNQLPYSGPVITGQQQGSQDQMPKLDWLMGMNVSQSDFMSFGTPEVQSPQVPPSAPPQLRDEGLQRYAGDTDQAPGDLWQTPARTQPSAPMSSLDVKPPYSSFETSSMAISYSGFDDSSIEHDPKTRTSISIPSLPDYSSTPTLEDYGRTAQDVQVLSTYEARPAAQQGPIASRTEHEIFEIHDQCIRWHRLSRKYPVKRAARDEDSREIGVDQSRAIGQPVYKRARHRPANADASRGYEGVSTDLLLRSNTAQLYTKRSGKRRTAQVSVLSSPVCEDLTFVRVADAELQGHNDDTDDQEGENHAESVDGYIDFEPLILDGILRARPEELFENGVFHT